MNKMKMQVKKSHPDHVGVILYNVDAKSPDSKTMLYKGVREILPLGTLGCVAIKTIGDYASECLIYVVCPCRHHHHSSSSFRAKTTSLMVSHS